MKKNATDFLSEMADGKEAAEKLVEWIGDQGNGATIYLTDSNGIERKVCMHYVYPDEYCDGCTDSIEYDLMNMSGEVLDGGYFDYREEHYEYRGAELVDDVLDFATEGCYEVTGISEGGGES